jgi:type IV pilus biogenesis protein CpaD/CtpE
MTTPSRGDDRKEKDSAEAGHRIEITGTLDRHGAEALQLELRRLAKRYGVEIKRLRVEKLKKGSSADRL